MKNFLLAPVFFCLLAAACAPPKPSEEAVMRYVRSQNLYSEGHFAEAAEMLAGENKFVPALVLRGKAEYFCRDLEKAEITLKRALKLEPANTDALLFSARLCRERGESEKARLFAEKILAGNPLDLRALRFAAELAGERGASGEAASAALLDRAVEASAESALVFLDRARLRWTGGNRNGALDDLRRARVLIPNDSPVCRAIEKLESIISEAAR